MIRNNQIISESRWVLLACLALLSGCGTSDPPPASTKAAPALPPLSVKVATPHRGEIFRRITLPGTVLAYQQALLCAKIAGYVKSVRVDKGDSVPEGELLAEVEVPELIADQSRLKAELQVAVVECRRVQEAQGKAPDLVTPQSVDNAKARVDIAQANLERNNTLLSFARITAPFSGVITRRMVDPGAFIPAPSGNGSNGALLAMMDFSKVRVQVAIPELEVPRITNGLPVRVQLEELPNRPFDGSVTRFSNALDDATRTMLTEIELPNPDRALRPGMFAQVQVTVERKSEALLVPTDAVLVEKANSSVFLLAGSKAKKTPVKTGFIDGAAVEIIDGLQPGQTVILVGKLPLSDGQEVLVQQPK